MRLPPGATLAVSLEWNSSTVVPVGRLGMRGRQVLVEFDRQFLTDGVELAPLQLRRRPGVIAIRDPVFDNLPGVFADSLPDGWGRLQACGFPKCVCCRRGMGTVFFRVGALRPRWRSAAPRRDGGWVAAPRLPDAVAG